MDYKKLIDDFNSGVLDKKKVVMVFDNDCGNLAYRGMDIGEDSDEDNQLRAKWKKTYGECGGYSDLVELALAAGIPAEWC